MKAKAPYTVSKALLESTTSSTWGPTLLNKVQAREYPFFFIIWVRPGHGRDTVTTRRYVPDTDLGRKNHTGRSKKEKKTSTFRSKNLSCLFSQELTSLSSLMSSSLSASCRCLHHGIATLLLTHCNIYYTDLLPRSSSYLTQCCLNFFCI